LKGEGKASKTEDQQENKKELKEEKQKLETREGLFLAFSTDESRRQNLLKKVCCFFLLFCNIFL
jgi:hypothetical protein